MVEQSEAGKEPPSDHVKPDKKYFKFNELAVVSSVMGA